MQRPKIKFNDNELDIISNKSDMSKLEILGLIDIMNVFFYDQKSIDRYNRDDTMGRFD